MTSGLAAGEGRNRTYAIPTLPLTTQSTGISVSDLLTQAGAPKPEVMTRVATGSVVTSLLAKRVVKMPPSRAARLGGRRA
jgi:hypothetical protein